MGFAASVAEQTTFNFAQPTGNTGSSSQLIFPTSRQARIYPDMAIFVKPRLRNRNRYESRKSNKDGASRKYFL
jgi:hypothetical protein